MQMSNAIPGGSSASENSATAHAEVSPCEPGHPAGTTRIEFDEAAYLAAFPDIAVSFDLGDFSSGKEHFNSHGKHEGRLTDERYIRAFGLGTPVSVADPQLG